MEIVNSVAMPAEPKSNCGRLRRTIFHNYVYMLTTNVESGIMLTANPLVKYIITSALLKAHLHHQVKISHFLVNGAHMHFLL